MSDALISRFMLGEFYDRYRLCTEIVFGVFKNELHVARWCDERKKVVVFCTANSMPSTLTHSGPCDNMEWCACCLEAVAKVEE